MKNLKAIDWVAKLLLVIGGLTWGIFGLFNFNLVIWLLGFIGAVSYASFVYIAVGIAAIWFGYNFFFKK